MKKLDKAEVLRVFNLPNKINLGIKDTGDWSLHDITESNHTLFLGGMASGRRLSVVSTAFAFLQGSKNGLVIVDDWHKGATDYEVLPSSRVIINKTSIFDSINFVYNEMLARKKMLQKNGKNNIKDYLPLLSPILLILEEASYNLQEFHWEKFHSVDNTPANKLKMILKDGAACGITLFAVGSKLSHDVLPYSFLKFFNHKRIFRFSDEYSLNHLLINPDTEKMNKLSPARCVDDRMDYQFLILGEKFIESVHSGDEDVKTLTPRSINKAEKSYVSFFEGKTTTDFFFD